MNHKLSVVISAFNEEKNIEECLKSVKDFADEVIVVDNSSTDKTRSLAKKLGAKVFTQENDPKNIDLQKNFGFSKATGDWILSLDADECASPELAKEIKHSIQYGASSIQGYEMPRKNIIFGKWIKHTGWYPDYQLRLFKKGVGKFVSAKVHEPIVVEGRIEKLTSPLLHENYQSINQFLSRTIIYTDSEAKELIKSGYQIKPIDALQMPVRELLRRFFTQEGYRDGLHGLILSLLMAFYHLIIFVKLWETNRFRESDENILDMVEGQMRDIRREFIHWFADAKKKETKNPIRKIMLKISQRI